VALNGVDLNLLPALDALLAERNVTRAAERMSLGQPAMSAVLARLRKHFGDPLLVREGRGLVLTTLAASLVAPVQEAMAATEAVLGARPPFDPRTDARSFTLVGSDYVALVLLRPLMPSSPMRRRAFTSTSSRSGPRWRTRCGAAARTC
jgi:DNA-binding transcriptional LysR family regulator